jgi:hypothetical protein
MPEAEITTVCPVITFTSEFIQHALAGMLTLKIDAAGVGVNEGIDAVRTASAACLAVAVEV